MTGGPRGPAPSVCLLELSHQLPPLPQQPTHTGQSRVLMCERNKSHLDTGKRQQGLGQRGAAACAAYRLDYKQFAALEVKQAHGARAVGEGQQGAVMAPRHLPPLRVWVLWHCGETKRDITQAEVGFSPPRSAK